MTYAMISTLSFVDTQNAHGRQDLIPGSRYTSARAAAMGDAGIAFGDDIASGLFYNPAFLAKAKGTVIEPLNLSFYGNMGYFSMLSGDFYKITAISSYLPTLQQNVDQLAGVGGAILPAVSLSFLSFGVLVQTQLASQVSSDDTLTYRSLYQIIPAMGFGFKLFDGAMSIGYSLQFVNSAVGVNTVPVTSSASYTQNLKEGWALSHNLGLAVHFPIPLKPSLQFVLRNALDAVYSLGAPISLASQPIGTPNTEPMSADVAVSIAPRLDGGLGVNMVGEFRDLTNQSRASLIQHLAMGVEFDFHQFLFIRGGLGGGYPTAGIGFKNKGTELSFAYYTEELGTTELSLPDSRILFQYRMRFF